MSEQQRERPEGQDDDPRGDEAIEAIEEVRAEGGPQPAQDKDRQPEEPEPEIGQRLIGSGDRLDEAANAPGAHVHDQVAPHQERSHREDHPEVVAAPAEGRGDSVQGVHPVFR